jgi:hypothetical protein
VIVDQLEQAWNGLIDISAVFITPNWGDPVSWLPELLLVLVIGPMLTLLAIAWLIYGVRKPRMKVAFVDARRPAPLDASGSPVFPAGEPYSVREQMIYEPGATRSAGGDELVVACPKCGLVRSAVIDTCGNCGLSFILKPTTRSARPAAPPPGGAAAA